MREIKFRAWDGKELVYRIIPYADGRIMQQYTGLKDKAGNEIYEGDIIEWKRGYSDDSIFDLWPTRPYVCKFENGKFILHCTPNSRPGGFVLGFDGIQSKDSIMTESEVIGNIYEHPHLLTNNKQSNE